MEDVRSRMRRALVALLAVAGAVLAGAGGAAAAPRWASCTDFVGPQCATVTVPLDRTGALPGTVPLRIARLAPRKGAETLVYLSGGPGGAGLEELLAVLWSAPQLARRLDVVTFDQRGTGQSGLLRCPQLEHDPRLRSSAAAEACARRLGSARRRYTTADSVEDLEAVRQALGVERLTLLGISYGTELALAYARAHPDHVARLALDSVVDPDDGDPFGLAGLRAMPPTLRALCPAGCRGVRADPAADLARLAARLARAPMRGRVFDARGVAHARTLDEVGVADLLYDTDYLPALRAGVPAAVRAALAGDAAPLLRLEAGGDALAELPPPQSFSSARYATVCEEAPLPWDPATPVPDRLGEARRRAAALGPAAFAPFDFATAAADEIELCLRWPGVPAAAPGAAAPAGSPAAAGYPAVPALVLQGGEDLRTPPEVSARVAARIPGAVRLVVPGVGHAVTAADPSGCGVRALLRFLAGGAVASGACPRVPTHVPAVALPPARLADVPLAGPAGLGTRVRRTLGAIALTLGDLRFARSPAFLTASGGGLRGGAYRVRGRRVVLRRLEAVPGVRLTGAGRGAALTLRIGGPGAAHGRVRVAGRRIAGRLGGRPVAVRLRAGARLSRVIRHERALFRSP